MTYSTKVLIVMWALVFAGLALIAQTGCARRQTITDDGVSVTYLSESEFLELQKAVLPQNKPLAQVFFDFDADTLKSATLKALRANAEAIKASIEKITYTGPRFIIEGHCDSRGSDEYNIALGQKRADAVMGYYVSLGIEPGWMETISYGEEKPFSNFHWQNRRAVTKIK